MINCNNNIIEIIPAALSYYLTMISYNLKKAIAKASLKN